MTVFGFGRSSNVSAKELTTVPQSFSIGFIESTSHVDISSQIDSIFSIDTVSPTVSINQAAGQADPTNTSPIHFTAAFSEAVTGFAAGDVTLNGTAGPTTAVVTGSGAVYDVAVSGMTAPGTVLATVAGGVALNAAGNSNVASTSANNPVTYVMAGPFQPVPGDVFREYTWWNETGDAGGAFPVGGQWGVTYPDRGWAHDYINAAVVLDHNFDLEHACGLRW